MSRAVRPRRPLGQAVMRGSVLVVGGRGGTGGASRVVKVMWSRTRGATVTLVAVVSTAGIPVMVGTAVVPWARVIPLSLEGTPVALENLRGELPVRIIYMMTINWINIYELWGHFTVWPTNCFSSWPVCLVEGGFHWGCFGSGWEEEFPAGLGWRQKRTWSYSGTDLSSLFVDGKL